ncbi:hypothetical protein [Larkinella arboricola]|uniref:hypothetical protein n=1 Tax=Larkinella arboricola TaxID=643671 RepID=UPI000DBA8828|nr:hypothetical protein [Larkinella arboricola]
MIRSVRLRWAKVITWGGSFKVPVGEQVSFGHELETLRDETVPELRLLPPTASWDRSQNLTQKSGY